MATSPATVAIATGTTPATVTTTSIYSTVYVTSDTTAWNWLEVKTSNVAYATYSPNLIGTLSPLLQSAGTVVAGGTTTIYFDNSTGTYTAGASAATILTIYAYSISGKTATIIVNAA
jgi:hypothetical protein